MSVRSGTTWTQQQKLVGDGSESGFFGRSVAIDGETILAGAPAAGPGASEIGAAFEFVRSGTTWSQQAKLLASDGANGDMLGRTADLDGDTAVLGPGFDGDSAAAYVFQRTGTS